MDTKLIVLGMENCVYCQMLVNVLDALKIKYYFINFIEFFKLKQSEIKDLEKNSKQDDKLLLEKKKLYNIDSVKVPYIFYKTIDDKIIELDKDNVLKFLMKKYKEVNEKKYIENRGKSILKDLVNKYIYKNEVQS